ncbi:TRAP transporter small permease subunit [Litoribrevibacter euphylliae]|uniref:TRAP transporter small permease protein n=1 Tax=Litoribrevibacter euphylliae TaxID=1834034 RepID=A0ABV7HJK5_9GAMM
MYEVFTALHHRLSSVTDFIGRTVSWLTLVMTLVMFSLVVLRYALNFNLIFLQESVLYLHAIVFLLGAGYTFKANEHVRVDILYREMTERKQALVNLFGCTFLLLPMMIFIGAISWEYISFSWSMQEKSQEAGGLPFVYLLKSMILGMVFTVILQGIAEICRCLALLLNPHAQKEAK